MFGFSDLLLLRIRDSRADEGSSSSIQYRIFRGHFVAINDYDWFLHSRLS